MSLPLEEDHLQYRSYNVLEKIVTRNQPVFSVIIKAGTV